MLGGPSASSTIPTKLVRPWSPTNSSSRFKRHTKQFATSGSSGSIIHPAKLKLKKKHLVPVTRELGTRPAPIINTRPKVERQVILRK
jgi:hypothetical protein